MDRSVPRLLSVAGAGECEPGFSFHSTMVVSGSANTLLNKEDFRIDLETGYGTCPAGQVTRRIRTSGTRTGPTGRTHQLKDFRFDGTVCGACPLRSQYIAGSSGLGRTMQLYPVPAVPVDHGGQPDPGGRQGRPPGQHRRRFQRRQRPPCRDHPFRT